jgi:DNA-binding transcriptional ArsR family regulator
MTERNQRAAVFLVSDLETLRVLTEPLRLQILETLDQKPQTVNQVAEKLGHSGSRLYYHFNLLEKHGLIEVVERRMVNNMIEKLYWTTAEDVEIDKSLLEFSHDGLQEGLVNLVSSSLEATRKEMLRSFEARSFQLDHGAQPMPRDVVIQSIRKRLKDETYQAFLKKFRNLLKAFRDLPEETGSDEDINTFSIACYLYPNFYYEDVKAEKESNQNEQTEKGP